MTKLVLPVKRVDAVLKYQHYVEASASQFALAVFLCGAELKGLKKEVGHGHWEDFFEANLARKKFSLRTAKIYIQVADSIRAKAQDSALLKSNRQNSADLNDPTKTANLRFLDVAPSEMTDEQIALVAAEIGKLTDAPTWGALMGDLGLAKLPHVTTIGGAGMVNADDLAAFLRNYYAHLDGTPWADLPEDVQSHFKRWVRAEATGDGETPEQECFAFWRPAIKVLLSPAFDLHVKGLPPKERQLYIDTLRARLRALEAVK